MPASTLEQTLAEIAAENPFLLVTPPDGGGGPSAYDVAMLTVAARPSLGEHLCNQIILMDLPEDVARSAQRLAYDLDESGFLIQDNVNEVAREHGLSARVARQAVQALQRCEPVGVGAFSLSDCIRLQFEDAGVPPERVQLILASLPQFTRGNMDIVAPALGLTRQEAEEIAALVRTLDPAPARAFDPPETMLRVPELVISDAPMGGLSVELLNDPLRRIGLDSELAQAHGNMSEKHLEEAKALIRSVAFRGKTLLAVGKAMVAAQEPFFSGHSDSLAPLTRSALADELGLHKSTVGRAITGKSLLWRGRAVDLESLFPAALPAAAGNGISSHAAQLALARIVTEERPGQVLSDEAIRAKLKEDGVDISRRTVAKYRKCLNIPSSSQRRRLKAQSAARRRAR